MTAVVHRAAGEADVEARSWEDVEESLLGRVLRFVAGAGASRDEKQLLLKQVTRESGADDRSHGARDRHSEATNRLAGSRIMRYPALSRSKCVELARQMIAEERPGIDEHVEWQGVGEEIDLDELRHASDLIIDEMQATTSDYYRERYRVEGIAAVLLYQALQHIDRDTRGDPRDDPAFWRYLSLAHFWEFIRWREQRPFAAGNVEKYVDAESATECVITRMYARGASVGGLDHLDSATAVAGVDFWRSHVLRIRTGTAPPVVRAFVNMQATHPLVTVELRAFAKLLTKTWANVVPTIYDDDDAAALIAELRREMFPIESE